VEIIHLCGRNHHFPQSHAIEYSGSIIGTTAAVHQFVAHQLC